ncbi:hypothetical protein [Methylobacterium sp. A54F]
MPLQRYLTGEAHVLAADPSYLRFGMTNGQRVVAVEVPIALLQDAFGGTDDDPLTFYDRNRDAIEAAASRAYDRTDTPNDRMEMTAEDFTPA